MSQLEVLCRPLIRLVCEYYCCARAGAPVNVDSLKWTIQIELENIRSKCENDPLLQRDFQKVEQPLVFFIDYTIKEGKFPFSQAWQPIARSYKELSGDEKFFDQLTENLDDPDSEERLRIFYILMGLGFDGCYKNEKEYVERRMKLCSVRSKTGKPLTKETLFSTVPGSEIAGRQVPCYSTRFWYIFGICVFLAIAAYTWNFYKLKTYSKEYWISISNATKETVKKSASEHGNLKTSPKHVEKTK